MGRGAAVQIRQVYHLYHLLVNTGEGDFWVAQSRFSKISLLVHTAVRCLCKLGRDFCLLF